MTINPGFSLVRPLGCRKESLHFRHVGNVRYRYPLSGVRMAINPGKRAGSNKWTTIFWLGVIMASGLFWVLAPKGVDHNNNINTPALIGHRVRFIRDAVGCPQLGSIAHLDNSIAAHDRVGFNRRMLSYGCVYIMGGAPWSSH